MGGSSTFIFSGNFRPFNTDLRIVPGHAAFVSGMVEVRAFVAELCYIAEYQEAVGKAFGNVKLFFVFFRKLYAEPFAVGLAVCPKVYSYIKDFSFDDPDQFALGELLLIVEAS